MGLIKSRIQVYLGTVGLLFGCKGTLCVPALQILIIPKLVPEVCHIDQFGIAASFLSTVCPDDNYKSAVRSMQVMLVSDIQTLRAKKCRSFMSQFYQSHQKKKNQQNKTRP